MLEHLEFCFLLLTIVVGAVHILTAGASGFGKSEGLCSDYKNKGRLIVFDPHGNSTWKLALNLSPYIQLIYDQIYYNTGLAYQMLYWDDESGHHR